MLKLYMMAKIGLVGDDSGSSLTVVPIYIWQERTRLERASNQTHIPTSNTEPNANNQSSQNTGSQTQRQNQNNITIEPKK